MKKISISIIALLLVIASFSQSAKYVVLITLDGSRSDFYLDTSWHAVNIRKLMIDGAYANGVNSVFPSMTYPSHTTIATGVWPAKHGVYYNNVFEPNGSTGKIYWQDSSIKVPTLWTAAQKKGLKTAAIFWPVSAAAPVNFNFPDIGSAGEKARIAFSKPVSLLQEFQKNVFHDTARIDYGQDTNTARMASYIIKKDKPNLMFIHFFGIDHFEHGEGRDGPRVRNAVYVADLGVGLIVKALKDAGIWNETVLIITGDHGFNNVSTNINPNVWLVKAGLITDVKKDNWKAQFFSVGGSSFLYLKDKQDKKTLSSVMEILSGLPSDQKKLFRIIDREKMNSVGGNPDVAFALSAQNGGSFGNSFTGEAIRPGQGGTHGSFPDAHEIQTGFVAHGPGINKGGIIPVMNLRDIAPTIAKLLGLPFPSADGTIPAGLLAR
jgi:predicted AlkP superfamily pyrophosphatase or phosphodiesterase